MYENSTGKILIFYSKTSLFMWIVRNVSMNAITFREVFLLKYLWHHCLPFSIFHFRQTSFFVYHILASYFALCDYFSSYCFIIFSLCRPVKKINTIYANFISCITLKYFTLIPAATLFNSHLSVIRT